jgi:hypothetical protein
LTNPPRAPGKRHAKATHDERTPVNLWHAPLPIDWIAAYSASLVDCGQAPLEGTDRCFRWQYPPNS